MKRRLRIRRRRASHWLWREHSRSARRPSDCTRKASSLPYRPRLALLSQGELAFYRVLLLAIRERWTISVKLRLADVILCPPSGWKTAHGARVSQKHLDFVLYDRETTAIMLAIELDDRSHARRERQARDAFVDNVLAACGVVLLRVAAAARYDVEALRMRVEASIERRPHQGRAAHGGRRRRREWN